jgi:integrase/recombinase XerD
MVFFLSSSVYYYPIILYICSLNQPCIMEIHRSQSGRKPTFLLLDSAERVAILPTDFIQSLERSPKNKAEGTLELYASRVRDFCSFLEGHQVYGQVCVDDAIRAMGLPLLDEFYLACTARGLQPRTVRGYEVVLKLLTDWLTTDEASRARTNPIYENISYRTPNPSNRMPRYLTVEQVITLLLGMNWEVHRLIAHFIFDTGLRVSEVPRVLKADLPLIEQFPSTQMYFPLLVRGSKGRGRDIKERYTMVSRAMLVRLNWYFKTRTYFTNHDWPENAKPAFLNTYGGVITSKAIQKFVVDALGRTRLTKASPQRLRHGTAYSVMKSEHGKTLLDNLVVLQRALGHTQLSTTEIYTHIPAPVLQRMTEDGGDGEMLFRFEEAQKILDATYLPEKKQSTVRRIGVRHV